MLNADLADWSRFVEADRQRAHLDKEGNPASYEDLLNAADSATIAQIEPDKLATRYAAAMANMDRIRETIRAASLDTLIVVGDDQNELYGGENMPCFLVYRGDTIRNVPLSGNGNRPEWWTRLLARYYEAETPREYPVDAALADHLIDQLLEREFDISSANEIAAGKGEGHAFGFVHNRLLQGAALPIVPVFINTYYPPNQASPRRCYRLGQAIADSLKEHPGDARIGILASGGLSHFTVDEELDRDLLRALEEKDADTLQTLPRNKLNGGSSEIRNWICAAGALERLPMTWFDYQPGYRTPAGTGTGLGFAIWS
jgi:3-O-methylgallate 3,4-dioxygenase